MAQASQKATGSSIPKSGAFIERYLSGGFKKKKSRPKDDTQPKLRGHEALVAKFKKGEKLKGVRAGAPGQPEE